MLNTCVPDVFTFNRVARTPVVAWMPPVTVNALSPAAGLLNIPILLLACIKIADVSSNPFASNFEKRFARPAAGLRAALTGSRHPVPLYHSKFAFVVLYRISPFVPSDGLSTVVPTGMRIADVAFTCSMRSGEAVPMPTLPDASILILSFPPDSTPLLLVRNMIGWLVVV
jgi:hypothetical protein